jgi:two-component system, NarL family, nitrate/nitrite sensor histidine kinase NarX
MTIRNAFHELRDEFVDRFTRSRSVLTGLLMVAGAICFVLFSASAGGLPYFHRIVDFVVLVALVPLVFGQIISGLLRSIGQAAADKSAALDAERRELSRELHDSIAQQLGYLHFQLDRMSQRAGAEGQPELAGELENMREVANEAYQDLHCLMSGLRTASAICLHDSLLDRAQRVGRRAGFTVDLSSRGEPQSLPASVIEQIQNIVREALANIEKHARAQCVHIRLLWKTDSLAVVVEDDGRGVAPGQRDRPGHFGLKIMQERTAQIGGTLQILSAPNSGTSVELWIPLAQTSSPPVPARPEPA